MKIELLFQTSICYIPNLHEFQVSEHITCMDNNVNPMNRLHGEESKNMFQPSPFFSIHDTWHHSTPRRKCCCDQTFVVLVARMNS